MPNPASPEAGSDEAVERSLPSRLKRAIVPGVVRRNYAVKFVLALLVVVVVVAGIGAISYVQIQAITEEDAENKLLSASSTQSDVLSEWKTNLERQTHGSAMAGVYATEDADRIRNHLRDSRAMGDPDIEAAHYVDPADEEIAVSSDTDYEGQSVSTIPTWSETIERATENRVGSRQVVSSDRAYEHDGKLLIAFAQPVSGGDGVLVVVADLRQALARNHGSETETTTRVLTADGREVDATRQPWKSELAETSAFETARDGEPAVTEHESDVVAFAPVDGTDWIVVAEAPTAQLYEASETVGRNVAFLVASTLVVLAAVGAVLTRGTVLPLIRLRERTRELESGNFDVDLRIDREDEIGRLFASFAQMRDSLQEQIRETEAAQERAERRRRELSIQNERLEQFASTVSHDLRNPLNVADGYRELLAMELSEDGADPEKSGEYIAEIAEAHERMGTIIDDVLALARDGSEINETVDVDLEAIATTAWASVDHRGATLESVGTRTLEADRDRLLRAFENLFRNAIEHGGPGVTVEVGTTGDGFYVADDGPGIPPDVVGEVFEYGRTTAEDGTGFGLAIVEAIVTAHDWTVDVDERFDEGAKFVVTGVGENGTDEDERGSSPGAERPIVDEA